MSAAAVDPVFIERLADRAWPAAERVTLGPWTLRAMEGVTRRANSAFTAGGADLPRDELLRLIEATESFYAERGQPAIFQISAATGAKALDELLASRGYGVSGASEVWLAPPRSSSSVDVPAGVTILRREEPDEAWFACVFDEAPQRRRVHETIARSVPRPRVFASAMSGGKVVGTGMATGGPEGYAGVFSMKTHPEHRRRGVGRAVLAELCAWARLNGQVGMYLQVMRDNPPAQALYRQAGFRCGYPYHYRVQPT